MLHRMPIVLVVGGTLAGCNGVDGLRTTWDSPYDHGAPPRRQSDSAYCNGLGAEPGSDAYVNCRVALRTRREQAVDMEIAAEMARSQTP